MVYPLLPAFRDGLQVEFSQLTRALTWRGLLGMFAPFIASVADSRGRKFAMLLGLAIFTGGVALVVFYPSFPAFVLSLILTVLGKYAFDPAMQAYLGDKVAYRRRGFALAMTEMGWSGATLIGIPAAGFLIARTGWIAPFPLFALLGLLAIFVLFRLLPLDPPPAAHRPGFYRNLGSVFRSPSALAGLSVTLLFCFANELVNLIFGVWLEDAFGLKIAALGAASIVIGLAELGGEGLVGAITDRLGKKRAVAIGLLFLAAATLALPYLGQTLPGAIFGLFLLYLTFEFAIVSSIPMMTELLPETRATLMAVNLASASLGRAIGAMAIPVLYSLGFSATLGASFVINLIALLALRWVRLEAEVP
jgi:predicted MFS family arabinose efflux permease